MPEFAYKCVDRFGRNTSGRVHSESKEGALIALRKQGLTPTSIREVRVSGPATAPGFGSVSIGRLAAYTRQFAMLAKTDIPLSEIFEILAEEEEGVLLHEASAHIAKKTGLGQSLGSAMAERPRVFSKLYIRMVEAGISSGTLDKVADHMAKMYEAESALRKKFMSKMVYPIAVLGFAFLVGLLLGAIGAIPRPVVMALIGFWMIIGALVILGMTRPGYRIYREIGFRIPWIGRFMRKINLARFCRVFGTQYAAGVPILEGLETSRQVMQDDGLERAIARIERYVHRGIELRDAMINAGVFPRQMVGMIGVGERAGGVEIMLEKLAEYYELDVDAQSTIITTVMYFVVMLTVAITVGLIVLSFWIGYWRNIGALIEAA